MIRWKRLRRVTQRLDDGQLLAGQKPDQRAAAGADIAHLLNKPVLLRCGDAVPSANDRVGFRDYEGLGIVLITLFVVVLIIENTSQYLRRKLS